MKKTHIANQSHEMVFSKMNLTTNEQKLLLTLIAQIDSKLSHIEPISITLIEMSKLYEKELRSRDLKRTLDKLNQPIWIEDDKYYIQTSIFSKIKVEKKTSDITFKFSEDIEKHLINLTPYVSTNIKNILPLKSVYSIRIYQFLKANLWNVEVKNEKFEVDLDYLKEILMTPKTYDNFNLFKTKVLTPAFEQINKETDIHFTYELQKKNKKVVGLVFDIKTNILNSQRIKHEERENYKNNSF